MARFFDRLHKLAIQVDVKTKKYTWDELSDEGHRAQLEEVENDARRANYYIRCLEEFLNIPESYFQDFFVVEEVTFSYKGRSMKRTFKLFDVIRYFEQPLIGLDDSALHDATYIRDTLMLEDFYCPYSVSIEDCEGEPTWYEKERSKQLKIFFGRYRFAKLLDAVYEYECGQ